MLVARKEKKKEELRKREFSVRRYELKGGRSTRRGEEDEEYEEGGMSVKLCELS